MIGGFDLVPGYLNGTAIQFNATGGYKAEVAVLYELGRALRIPVYYLHETYKVAITLP
jgi:putative CRISPR-associated protein (TIGR02619 family)